jgi:outer membrane protein assembly factor BamB
MKVKKVKVFYLSILLASLSITNLVAQSPHGWRGPDRSGSYNEQGLLKNWSKEGPKLLWETMDAGKGYSSPVIVNDRLYITGMTESEDKEIFSAYSLDGKKIYEIIYGTPWKETHPETRTTPTIDGDKAYVVSGAGEVVCINITNGEIVWKADGNTLGRMVGIWGTCESLLVFDDKVIYTPAGEQTTVVAFNKENGEIIWKSKPLNEHSSYVSPLLIKHNGKRKIIGVTATNVVSVDAETGNIDWTFDDWGQTKKDERIAPNTPLYHNGQLFFAMGYNMGAFALKLNADATSATLAWRNKDMDTHHGHNVLVDGIIYGPNWITNGSGNWMAVDWETGKTKYEQEWKGKSKGSIITADGMLYCYEERLGTVGLVKINPEKFEVVSEFRITKGDGPHWAHPVINDGVLYIRHGFALMAYQIK